VGAPYEAPTDPDLTLGGGGETVEQEVEHVLELLRTKGLLSF
jgi:adenylylsulfate kinase-like enzyme